MVKNTQGGSKHKGLARKSVNAAPSAQVRVPKEEGECFAYVTAMLGNGMCKVDICHNDAILTDLTCFIRGKFKSKSKRQNLVTKTSFLIVGLRLWSSDLTKCDLLQVLQPNSISSIYNNPQFSILHTHIYKTTSHFDDELFDNSNIHIHNHNDSDNDNDNDIDIDTVIDIDIDLI